MTRDAFAFVADIGTHPEWSVDDIRVLTAAEPPIGVGSRYRTVGHSVVREEDHLAELEVTVYDPPLRFAFIARSEPREFTNLFTFDPDADGTRVERAMTFTPAADTRMRMQSVGDQIAEHNHASMELLKERWERS